MNVFALITGTILSLMPLTKVSYADFVNTSVGVTDNRGSNCVIGPMMPYGSINPSPQTFKGGTDGYDPAQPIDGFAQLHVSGTGWSSYGHFLIQPQTGELNTAPGSHSSAHSEVVSKPYIFSTTLERYGVKVEVAPSYYSAIYRFTYPQSESSSILFDASQSIARDIATYMGGTLKGNEVGINPEEGSVRMKITINAGWPYGTYDLYSVAYVDKKMETFGVWEDSQKQEGVRSISCDTISTAHKGAWCSFKTEEGERVTLKLAISFTGYDRAEELLRSEIPGWDFDKVAAAGRKDWNRKLSSIRLDNVTEEQMTLFYSALYRVFTLARDRSLDNCKWESDYPFWDDNYAYWDTFRTAYPLLLLIDQDAFRGNVLSMIDRFEHNGCVYDGFIAGIERVPEQGGNNVDCIIAEAYLKGVKGIDWEKAYAIVKHNADERRIGCHSLGGKASSAPEELAYTRYKELGYIPTCKMSTSQTLEFAYNDYCAALMAEGLGHSDDAARWFERSHKWVALWNPDLADGQWKGFLDGRDEDGTFQNIDPRKYGGSWVSPFYEGSAWTYNYYVPHDFERMIELMGGPETFVEKLNFGFEKHLVKYDNEPGFLATRAFVHAGRPDLSSYWVHHSMHNGFDMDGYPGNEDTGAMGSWYVFCNLGLCPSAGQDFYYLNAPIVGKSTITLPGGKKLKIKANASPENVYIKSCKVNGKDWNSPFLPYSAIRRGCKIVFELSSEPTDWGKGVTSPQLPGTILGRNYMDTSRSFSERAEDLVSFMTLDEKVSQMMNSAPAIERLGVPAYNWWNECLHGVARTPYHVTSYPQAIGLAATWDVDAVRTMAGFISDEGRAIYNDSSRKGDRDIYLGLTYWSPNVNIFRDPRWGRGQETYGEDPYLTSRLGVAFVKGLQGDDPHYLKASACAKHFAAHSGPEKGRSSFNSEVSVQDLWDTYLPAFDALVNEAGVSAVMGAYNAVNGQPCCANYLLMNDILRDKWHFGGYVTSDCGAIVNLVRAHKIHDDPASAAADAVRHGVDVECSSDGAYGHLAQAVEQGLISEAEIDRSVARLMETRMRLGMFDPAEMVPFSSIGPEILESGEHSAHALKMARESMVLLKNDSVLPLGNDVRKIALVGPNADNEEMMLANYFGTPSRTWSLYDGLKERLGDDVDIVCEKGCGYIDGYEGVSGKVADADVILFAGGLCADLEGESLPLEADGFSGGDRTSIELPSVQKRLLAELAATGKPVVLILFSGSPFALEWEDASMSAILEAWYPGQAGGLAVADVLTGAYNPSGRLPLTFYKSDNDLPGFNDYSMEGRTYRYFKGEPLYPFGYGLSYTEFEYSGLKVSGRRDRTVSVDVTNVGDRDGEEVVQVYVSAHDMPFRVPVKALKAFRKVAIPKGETTTVTFHMDEESFLVVDDEGFSVPARGRVTISVGDCSMTIY